MTYLKEAAKWYKAEPHQDAAWGALEAKLPKDIIDEFRKAYSAPRPPLVKPGVKAIMTPEIFSKLTGVAPGLFTQQECDDCNMLLQETGFSKHLEPTRMLMANILHETGNMRHMKEIASGAAYNGRSDLGNTQPGDGPRFKGAGVLQLTGRHNYSRLSKDLGDPRILEGVDYVSRTYPFRSAKTWIVENGLLNVALNKGFDAVCRRINGGWNGYDDRLKKYQLCKQFINF